MNAFGRMIAWFACVLLAIGIFCLLWGPEAFFFVFRITLILALPVAVLYLPVVLAVKDAQGQRLWQLLVSGILIGPASLASWGLILWVRGAGAESLWHDDLAPGFGACLVFAFVVGLLTITAYVTALKLIPRRWPKV